MSTGASQGFMLSSVLLNIYINDLKRELKIKLMKFTDDATSGNSANPGREYINYASSILFCTWHFAKSLNGISMHFRGTKPQLHLEGIK